MPLKLKGPKNTLPDMDVNVVSLMDILTTMLFFLLMFAAFSQYSFLKTSALLPSQSMNLDQPIFTLEVKAISAQELEIFLGPTRGLTMVNQSDLQKHLKAHFTGNEATGFKRRVKHSDFNALMDGLEKYLVPIKKSFPHEFRAVLSVTDNITYQEMITLMNQIREAQGDNGVFELKSLVGVTEKTRVLFPQVILSEASL